MLGVFRQAISAPSGPGAPPIIFTNMVIVVTLIAGTAFIMWMGELITQRGIGNGMSLLIFASIVVALPVGDHPVVHVRERAASRSSCCS